MAPPRHVVIACPGCGLGGSVGEVATKHARELSAFFKVTLVSDSLPSVLSPQVHPLVVHPRRFDYLRRFCHVPNEYSFARTVRSALAELHGREPIIMLVCHGHATAALAAIPMKRRHKVPYAMVVHGDIFERPKGTYDTLLTLFYKLVTPPAYRNADLVIALSPHVASLAVVHGAASDAVKVVPNGIDPADIGLLMPSPEKRPRSHGNNSAPIRLLFVGRLSIEKGCDILIEACRLLAETHVPFVLDVIGTGPQERHLRELTARYGLSRNVNFMGRIERKSLSSHYCTADLLCVPSRSDTFPGVVLEAEVCSTPVVGSNVGGIPFMVEYDRNGILVPAGQPEPLAEAIRRLAEDADMLQRMSYAAVTSVFPEFSWASTGKRIAEYITQVVA